MAIARLLLLSTLAFGGSGATAQSSQPTTSDQAESQPRVTAKDSIEVGAHSTPEEVEKGKINDAYQLLYHLSKQTDGAQKI